MDHPTPLPFSENLTHLRQIAGETQAELAAALGVTNKAVSKWETGECEPELAAVTALARHFHTTTDRLLTGAPVVSGERLTGENFRREASALTDRLIEEVCGFVNRFHCAYTDLRECDGRPPLLPPEGLLPTVGNGSRTRVTVPNCMEVPAAYTRTEVPELFLEARATKESNLLVLIRQNADNFRWLETRAEDLRQVFALLGRPHLIDLIRLMHTQGCSRQMTTRHMAELTGCAEEDAKRLLTLLGREGETVEFDDGPREVYDADGAGYLLLILIAAYHAFFGSGDNGTMLVHACYKPICGGSGEDVR